MENIHIMIALQKIDLQLDELRQIKGDLPEQIEDLQADLEGSRLKHREAEKYLLEADNTIKKLQNEIATSEEKIEKYKAQQFDVRNNREYDALTKEVDVQSKNIITLKDKINEVNKQKANSSELIEALNPKIQHLETEVEEKKEQLKMLTVDTDEEEKILLSDRKKVATKADKKSVDQYERMRNARDGRVIVKLSRGACGGCFKVIPMQRQNEIKRSDKTFICDHCGRIIVTEDTYNKN